MPSLLVKEPADFLQPPVLIPVCRSRLEGYIKSGKPLFLHFSRVDSRRMWPFTIRFTFRPSLPRLWNIWFPLVWGVTSSTSNMVFGGTGQVHQTFLFAEAGRRPSLLGITSFLSVSAKLWTKSHIVAVTEHSSHRQWQPITVVSVVYARSFLFFRVAKPSSWWFIAAGGVPRDYFSARPISKPPAAKSHFTLSLLSGWPQNMVHYLANPQPGSCSTRPVKIVVVVWNPPPSINLIECSCM